jgi:hypothetical protein
MTIQYALGLDVTLVRHGSIYAAPWLWEVPVMFSRGDGTPEWSNDLWPGPPCARHLLRHDAQAWCAVMDDFGTLREVPDPYL